MKKLFILAVVLVMTSCYNSDYQEAVNKEFPNSKSFKIDRDGTDIFIVIDKDSSVYFVECNRFMSTKPSTKQYLFNIKK